MPLNKLIDLLAEAAVRKLSQEREKKEATPDAMIVFRAGAWRWPQQFRNLRRYVGRLVHCRHNPEARAASDAGLGAIGL